MTLPGAQDVLAQKVLTDISMSWQHLPPVGQRASQVLGILSDLQCNGAGRRFKHMMWTSHVQQPGEMRGKASNVDWAAREAHVEFGRLGAHCKGTLWSGHHGLLHGGQAAHSWLAMRNGCGLRHSVQGRTVCGAQ